METTLGNPENSLHNSRYSKAKNSNKLRNYESFVYSSFTKDANNGIMDFLYFAYNSHYLLYITMNMKAHARLSCGAYLMVAPY